MNLSSYKDYESGKIKFLRDLFNEDMQPLDDFDEAFDKAISVISTSSRDLEILISFYFWGSSYKELANKYNISESRISIAINNAMYRLRSILPRYYFTKGVEATDLYIDNVKRGIREDLDSDEIKTLSELGLSDVDIKRLKSHNIRDTRELYSYIVNSLQCVGLTDSGVLTVFNVSGDDVKNMLKERHTGTPIDILSLSSRAYNALIRSGYRTLESIERLTKKDLYSIRNLGESTFKELQEKCEPFGIIFKE